MKFIPILSFILLEFFLSIYLDNRKRFAIPDARKASSSSFGLKALTNQLNLIGSGYVFICLLNETDSSDELNDIGCDRQIFFKPYECLSCLATKTDQKLILIVSQSLATNFIPLIHDLIQVIYIYIQHNYDSYHEVEDDSYINNKQYYKIRGSFIEQTALLTMANDDLKQLTDGSKKVSNFTRENTTFDFYTMSKQPSSSLKSLSNEESMFVSHQIILKTIVESGSENPLNKLSASVELCRKLSEETTRQIIDNLRHKYVSDKAINMYMNNASLQDMLNTCFYTKNMQTICKLWFLIRDLLKQFPENNKPIKVYHGQYYKYYVIQKLRDNVGNLITFPKFFTMSTSNICTIHNNEKNYFKLKFVVFHLEMSVGNTNARFVTLQQSYDETILLFAIGNIFRIESVEELTNEVYHCKLSINSDNSSELDRIIRNYEQEIGTQLTYLSMGSFLNELGRRYLAQEYYEILLKLTTDSNITSCIQNNLAIIYEHEKDLKKTRNLWEKVAAKQDMSNLKIPLFSEKQNSVIIIAHPVPNTSPIINYYNLACVYRHNEHFDEALEACEKAFELSATSADSLDIALVHSAKGSIYFCQDKYTDALKSFELALDCALVHRSPTDPLLDQYLNNIRLLKNEIYSDTFSDMETI